MDKGVFFFYLFELIHKWSVHVSLTEYVNFGNMLFNRIIKYVKLKDGERTEFYPRMVSKLAKTLSPEEFLQFTYEEAKEEEEDDGFYEIIEDDTQGKRFKKVISMVVDAECYSVVYDEVNEFDSGYSQTGLCEVYRVEC